MASRRTVDKLTSTTLFLAVAFVAGFITATFTESWVWPVVVGAVAGAVSEWVYAFVRWKRGGRATRGRGNR